MLVNIPYMEHMGNMNVYIYIIIIVIIIIILCTSRRGRKLGEQFHSEKKGSQDEVPEVPILPSQFHLQIKVIENMCH